MATVSMPSLHVAESVANESLPFLSIRYILGLLYFCNQRPAPFLLARGWEEHSIGFVLFISGLVGLIIQTPAGQLSDETPHKRRIIWIANAFTMIGCTILLSTANFVAITLAVSTNVISEAFTFPALYSLTLGIVGPAGIIEQVPVNETFAHCGNAFFAAVSGLIVALSSSSLSIFWICIAMRAISSSVMLLIREKDIDNERARGLELVSGAKMAEPMAYWDMFSDYHVFVFLLSVLFFHFSNAAMLPLLSQQLFIGNADRGFEFAALAVITAQVSMVCSAVAAGILVPIVGTKPMFLIALAAVPLRGFIIVILLGREPNNYLLLGTQVLDGVAGGLFGVLVVLVAENIARGSGRFAMLVGMAKTAEGMGAAFSNLVGETLAGTYGYRMAFTVLSLCALIPMLVYGLFMPPAKVHGGVAVDELSVSVSRGGDSGGMALSVTSENSLKGKYAMGGNATDVSLHDLDEFDVGDGVKASKAKTIANAARRAFSKAAMSGYRPVQPVVVEPPLGGSRRHVRNPMVDSSSDRMEIML